MFKLLYILNTNNYWVPTLTGSGWHSMYLVFLKLLGSAIRVDLITSTVTSPPPKTYLLRVTPIICGLLSGLKCFIPKIKVFTLYQASPHFNLPITL